MNSRDFHNLNQEDCADTPQPEPRGMRGYPLGIHKKSAAWTNKIARVPQEFTRTAWSKKIARIP